MMTLSSPCPCGSTQSYTSCCGVLHQAFKNTGKLLAPTAEALMRSRYSAYVLDLTAYLLASWHASTRPSTLGVNEPGLRWLGLEVKRHQQQDADQATVEFVARSKLGGRAQRLHEVSRFVREDSGHGSDGGDGGDGTAWYYLDGQY